MKLIDERTALRAYVDRQASQQEAAKKLGISATFIIDILKGYRKCPARVLDVMGFRRPQGVLRKWRKRLVN